MEQQFKVLQKGNVTRYFKVLPSGGCEEIAENDIPKEILEQLLNPTSSDETSSDETSSDETSSDETSSDETSSETKTSRRGRTKTTEE